MSWSDHRAPSVRMGRLAMIALQRAMREGWREFDFLSAAVPYKLEFTRCTRPILRIRAARRSLAELARSASRVARDALWACPRLLRALWSAGPHRASRPKGSRS